MSHRFVQMTERALDEMMHADLPGSVCRPILVVLDGAKTLDADVRETFDRPVIHRCPLHKIRNVEGYLPTEMAATVTKKMRATQEAA